METTLTLNAFIGITGLVISAVGIVLTALYWMMKTIDQRFADAQKANDRAHADAQKANDKAHADAQKANDRAHADAQKANDRAHADAQKANDKAHADAQKINDRAHAHIGENIKSLERQIEKGLDRLAIQLAAVTPRAAAAEQTKPPA